MRKTLEVEEFVRRLLEAIPERTGNITALVFDKIWENRNGELDRYNDLVGILGRRTVNPWIGKYTSRITGLRDSGRKIEARSSLVKKVSELL